jgi:hypothetical protein
LIGFDAKAHLSDGVKSVAMLLHQALKARTRNLSGLFAVEGVEAVGASLPG